MEIKEKLKLEDSNICIGRHAHFKSKSVNFYFALSKLGDGVGERLYFKFLPHRDLI